MAMIESIARITQSSPFQLLAGLRAFIADFLHTAFNPYHPEQQYMRGPGPACAAKRDALRTSSR